MKVEVIDINGKGTGRKVELSDSIFGIEPNEHAIYLDVKQYLAHQRQGTHKAKERGEIVGSTRKIKKQKGTGTARAGSIKSPVFRGGGRIFGPRPRSYQQKLNKNVKRLARKSALSMKSNGNEIKVIEDFNFDGPKTKSFVSLLGALGLSDSKSLFVVSSVDQNVYLSARNVQSSNVITSSNVNTYKILDANTL
ncbi:MAG: 50S ribosomal protein L4, partial [Flavobacteriaceae bacterium]|nr:50S ribosomal protein L4 [Flavobacteriaceae bacterium]